ncbi:lupus La protein [Capronia epimyces CBS 606.96]|uniref:Lupus La protein n=1 Tax=Capronia epimyces CBS 606.96 TaxID=1182542 RepID=W9XI79_9EURO|nr:lupus La protein [Capronia epimyces CBS 606.96]EXJ77055.1 lupus La protein [Capronia epimyces CBS 606.96]
MSVEEAVTDALQTPVDQNAQAAEDAKALLAELQGETENETKTQEESTGTNGTTESKAAEGETTTTESKSKTETENSAAKRDTSDKFRDRRDRSEFSGRGRGRGGQNGHGSRNYRDNIKSDVTLQETSSDPVAIRKQVEFYFSDSNLPHDKFLLSKVGGSQNNPVELTVIHSFKRMRHFQPFEAIVEALRESKILELTDDDTSVRRREPLPESLNNGPDPNAVRIFEDRAMPRTVYAKGFGEEVPSTQFDIEAFFAPYGPTNAVRLRRTEDKIFKSSVFVEFETEELAQAFLDLDPKPKFKGKDLQIMSKKEYCDKKVEDIKAGKIRPNNKHERNRRNDRGGRDGKRKRDEEDSRDWRTRRDEDRKQGFRDDKKRGNRDRDFKGGRGGRNNGPEKNDRGIPTVKSSAQDTPKPSRDSGRDDALAKAKAAVEAETKKDVEKQQAAVNVETTDAEATAGKKRAREDDGGEAEAEREVKKVDSKTDS